MCSEIVHLQCGNYLLIFAWDKTVLSIHALCSGYWHSSFNEQEILGQLHGVNMNIDQYVNELFGLSKSSDHANKVDVEPHGSHLTMFWTKEIQKGIKVKLGTFRLEQSVDLIKSYETCTLLLLSHIQRLSVRLTEVEKDKVFLQSTCTETLKKYEDVVSAAELKELDLLSKFVAVLNEKKKKIALLEHTNSEPNISDSDTIHLGSLMESQLSEYSHTSSIQHEREDLLPNPHLSRVFTKRRLTHKIRSKKK